MPTYQYRCTDCGTPLEVVQTFAEPALTDCPTCTGRLRKVYSAVGVVFKGSGFYRNDSRASVNGHNGGKDKANGGDEPSDAGAKDKPAEKSGDGAGDKGGDKAVTKGAAGGGKAAAATESARKPSGPRPTAASSRTTTRSSGSSAA